MFLIFNFFDAICWLNEGHNVHKGMVYNISTAATIFKGLLLRTKVTLNN